MVADQGLPVFFRELFLGADASLSDFRKVDLGGCLAFAQKQLGVGNLTQLRVSGTNSPYWPPGPMPSRRRSGRRRRRRTPPAMLGIKGGDWGGYASIGASMRYLALDPCRWTSGRSARSPTRSGALPISALAVTGAIAIFFAVVGFVNNAMFKYKERILAEIQACPGDRSDLRGEGQDDIEAMLKSMQSQTGMSQNLNPNRRYKTTAILKDVVDSLPEKVWLTSLTHHNPVVAPERNPAGSGGTRWRPRLGEEQELCFRRFGTVSRRASSPGKH